MLEYVDGVELVLPIGGDRGAARDACTRLPRSMPVRWPTGCSSCCRSRDCLDLEPWIRPAVEGAVADAVALGSVSWAWLHGDPAAEAFLRQADGEVALIDWGSAMRGPILYDVASAVMYNGDPVVPAYLRQRPDLTDELERGLPTFLRVRYAVQAGYFAWRITNNILTGISGPPTT